MTENDRAERDPTDDSGTGDGDTFGVGIAVDAEEFRFVVHVPSEIDAGWRDPEAFQERIEAATWDVLDKRETLRAVATRASEGDTVTLGTVTMRPDGTVLAHSLSVPGETAGSGDDGGGR